MSDRIAYDALMHDAMRGVVRQVLSGVALNGTLPGAHHFFITFDTGHEGVEIAAWLQDRYPTEMTIVIQHWFDNLDVGEDGFSVTLNFGNRPEPLHIPYAAILTFVDPSVEFGLRFEGPEGQKAEETISKDATEETPEADTSTVVSLDAFRKS